MESIYISYTCAKCKKTIILLREEVDDTKNKNKYLACAHCGSKRIYIESQENDLRKCMRHSAYKREHGAIRQVAQEWKDLQDQ